MKNTIGLIGLAVMGENLARNIASRGYTVSVFNRTAEKTRLFIAQTYSDNLHGTYSLVEFVASLTIPRKIIIMVKAGEPVDAVITELRPLLDAGDIIIDCGNSYYEDTERRSQELQGHSISYIGCGVSGGEEGALHGPSIMPGGTRESYELIRPILEAISAEDFTGGKCVSYIGSGGSGHFVKMVHNGIEYAIMQMMAEVYDIYRKIYTLESGEIAAIYTKYNQGRLNSYLCEIAATILAKKDDLTDSGYLIDSILDRAGAKGTGLWTSLEGLKHGVSSSCITEATVARMISSDRPLREKLSTRYTQIRGDQQQESLSVEMTTAIEDALHIGMILSYTQGLSLIQKVSLERGWDIDLSEVTRIWQGGCIIRAELLTFLTTVLGNGDTHESILELPEIRDTIEISLSGYRTTLALTLNRGIATPSLSSGIQYLYSITENRSPANFIQGQRDYFGAHTYERIDRAGTYHTTWQ